MLAPLDHAELLAHAPFADHLAGDAGGLADVATSAVCHVAEEDLLRDASAHDDDEPVEQFLLVVRVTVALGQAHREPERRAARDDRDLVQGIGVRQQAAEEGVASLVIGGVFLFLVAHGERAALAAPADLVARVFQLETRDRLEPLAGGEERGLIHHIGEFRAAVAGRAAGDDGHVHVLGEFHLLGMDAENFLAAFHVGQRDGDLPVEAARAQERGVEHVGAVCGGDDDNAFLRIKAVHLDQESVERLLALVMAAAEAVAAVPAHGVDFVDEDEARRGLLALLEHVAHTARTDADEHFHEVRAADREERHVGLACDGAREQRLAGAWRPDHEHALRDASAELLEALRISEELHDFLHFILRLLDARHVLEGHLVLIASHHAGLGLAEVHRPLARHADLLAEEEIEDEQEEQDRH